jgi:hypothetical protein
MTILPNRAGRTPLHLAADPPLALMTPGHVVRHQREPLSACLPGFPRAPGWQLRRSCG